MKRKWGESYSERNELVMDAAAVQPGIDLMAVCHRANEREEIGGSGVMIDYHGNGH